MRSEEEETEEETRMLARITSRRTLWAILGGLLTASALLVLLAPPEQTLGVGIKAVYVHVALIWAGMTGLALAGLIGLAVAVLSHETLQSWGHTIGWVALALFVAGYAMSFVAAIVNWGGVFLAEPRYQAALSVLVLALAVQISNGWLPWLRVRGVLSALVAVFLGYAMATTEAVLHPENAVFSSPSTSIRSTFFGLFILVFLAGVWAVYYVRSTRPA